MKKLGIYSYEGEHGELLMFFSGDNLEELIAIVDQNDADWRHEYLNPVLSKVGVDVVTVKLSQEKADKLAEDWYS